MKKKSSAFGILLLLCLSTSLSARNFDSQPQVYVVYIGEHIERKTPDEIEEDHYSYLISVKGSREAAKASLVYSYKNAINGFSAVLTPDEAAKLSEMEGVVSVFRSHPRKHSLHTTRSWDFVSLLEAGGGATDPYKDLLRKAKYGKDVIVGVVDSGIWPESESFSDKGMGPVPKSWKGICQAGVAFNKSHCNRKIIGARYYLKSYEAIFGRLNNSVDYRSPRDIDGHGTHTASTVGGRAVPKTFIPGGFAYGTASGGAALVRLAIYKACWPVPGKPLSEGNTCQDDDLLAAIDDAIGDGVDVLSISIGGSESSPYNQDGIAIGALHAVKRNIVVSCSAGNSGPTPSSVTNVAPWILTVAASSIDRTFLSPVALGNDMILEGESITPVTLRRKHRVVFSRDVELPSVTLNISGQCLPSTLSRNLTRGKIVLCVGLRDESALEVERAGGAGVIQVSPYNGNEIPLTTEPLSTTAVLVNEAKKIVNYTRFHKNPVATLIPGNTTFGKKPAPVVAPFSSVGPNGLDPNIIKPDITAPGLNILAAWSGATSPTKLAGDKRRVKYNILSGTSMSCPHVSAVAAILKAIHPDWSSAAIRSALMTTAGQSNNIGGPITNATGYPATPFEYGSGHFQPAKAADPGLVYDVSYQDYHLYLCSSRYRLDQFKCPKNPPSPSNLNYPSLSISNLDKAMAVTRTVTNVGARSVYRLTVKPPTGFSVQISPKILHFGKVGEKRKFSIIVKRDARVQAKRGHYSFGWFMWSDGVHTVRSPMAVSPA